jgi:hypothetical protein
VRIGRIEDTFPNICRGCYWIVHWNIKYYFWKAIGKKPLKYIDAMDRWDDIYSSGNNGIYASDGVYFRLSEHAILHGYIPLWIEQDSQGNDRYAYSGKRVGLFKR